MVSSRTRARASYWSSAILTFRVPEFHRIFLGKYTKKAKMCFYTYYLYNSWMINENKWFTTAKQIINQGTYNDRLTKVS